MGLSKERGIEFQKKYDELEYKFANIELNKQIEKLEKAMEGKSSYKDIIIENQQKKIDKQKEVLDKIKKYILEHCEIILHEEENTTEVGKVDGKKLLELLEEIE